MNSEERPEILSSPDHTWVVTVDQSEVAAGSIIIAKFTEEETGRPISKKWYAKTSCCR